MTARGKGKRASVLFINIQNGWLLVRDPSPEGKSYYYHYGPDKWMAPRYVENKLGGNGSQAELFALRRGDTFYNRHSVIALLHQMDQQSIYNALWYTSYLFTKGDMRRLVKHLNPTRLMRLVEYKYDDLGKALCMHMLKQAGYKHLPPLPSVNTDLERIALLIESKGLTETRTYRR